MTATQWLDSFFELYYRRNPVNATFTGVHEYDAELPDCSPSALIEYRAEAEALLGSATEIGTDTLPAIAALDIKVACGALRIQSWELKSHHFQRGNPSYYTGEAVFSVIGLFLTNYAPVEERVHSAIIRMNGIPRLLDQARDNLQQAPAPWIDRARAECDGAEQLFGNGLSLLAETHGITDPEFLNSAGVAAAAFQSFDHFLANDLAASTDRRYQCGAENLTMITDSAHFLHRSLEEIADYAEHEMRDAQEYVKQNAGNFGADSPAEALARLADHHPTQSGYLSSYDDVWSACRQSAISQNLVTWPESPIRYEARPTWVRSAAPNLYFLFYRSPASFNRPDEHVYMVEPVDANLPAEEAEVLLRRNNDSVIKLNHVVHHGAIGHHVQNWHAARAKSRIGRIAAIDCASRIGLLSGGTMAEGWACYATTLMEEHGFLTGLESYAEVQGRARMAARAVVDVKLHTGVFDLDQAAAFYEANAGMPPAAAHSEAVKNSMFPGGALMYLNGMDLISDLRNRERIRRGDSFDLCRFHDRFLSFGSLPVQLICDLFDDDLVSDGASDE